MADNQGKIMIETQAVSKYYGPFVAVKDISFSIPEGQIVSFLGPNGAGKSTTMKILAGFLAPSEGTASVAGFDVSLDRLKAARHMGYLPENGPLYDDMTPMELLKFFGEARGLSEKMLRERLEVVVDQCAIGEVVEKPIGKLSRGFRQRVGLAQVLLHDPSVLILDEPTAGLDPNQIRDFRENIKVLGRSKTVLISTHILQEVDAVADRVLLVNDGKLIYDGDPEGLRSEGTLEKRFYELTGRPGGGGR